MLNNIIAYYGLLVAILLPIIILLMGNMKNSPKIDKQVLFKILLPAKQFGILFGVFVLPGIQFLLFNSYLLENTISRLVTVIITVTATSYIFYSITKIIAWISSGENKEAFHGFYRQSIRLEFLKKGTTEEKSEKWYQFWSDEKTIKYFGNDICRYIDEFFVFVHNAKKTDWKYTKKSCFAFYYNMSDLYKIGKKELRLNAYDNRSLAKQLINTIPFSLCSNLIEDVDSIQVEKDGVFIWSGVIASLLLKEMEKDDNLKENEWLTAFNMSFFGIKKNKEKALTAITITMIHFAQKDETRQSVKKRINKLMEASDDQYKPYYQQLYKELFSFDPNQSELLDMVEKGVSNG